MEDQDGQNNINISIYYNRKYGIRQLYHNRLDKKLMNFQENEDIFTDNINITT